MKCHPGRWWWGLIPVAILIWLASFGEHQAIQADLRARTSEQLSLAGMPWATAGFSGRDGIVIGQAASKQERQRAAEVAGNVWGVRLVENHALEPAPPEAIQWSAERGPRSVRLSGMVPSETTRKKLVAAVKARFPAHTINDGMVVGRGRDQHPDWLSDTTFAIEQLHRLSDGGQVGLEGRSLKVAGRAGTSDDYRQARVELAQSLPGGLRLKEDKILPPSVSPYVWVASYRGNEIELKGHVPDEGQRDEMLAHARRSFPNATIIDRMVTATGEPPGWQLSAMRSLSQLAALREGELAMSDRRLVLKGLAEREETAVAVSRALKEQVPQSFEVIDEITFRRAAIPTIKPFVTVIEAEKGGARVTGHVPSEEARTSLLESVKALAKGVAVRDDTQLGAGADKGWLTCLRAGLQGLAKIGGGKLVLTDRRLELSGQTADQVLVEETAALVRAATNRACDLVAKIAVIDLPEPDLTWTVTWAGDVLVLSGEVPDEPTGKRIMARAHELFAGVAVRDEMKVKSALSAKWQEVAFSGLEMLAKLRRGSARIEAQLLTISGEATDTVTASAIRDSLRRDMPHGYTGHSNVEVRSAAMLWADQEARRKEEEEARRKSQSDEAERRKRDEAARLARDQAVVDAARSGSEQAAARQRAETERRLSDKQRARSVAAEAERQRALASQRATEQARSDAERAVSELQRDIASGPATAAGDEQARRRRIEAGCQDVMRTTVGKGRIQFARGLATLRKESYPTLDRLAQMIRVCKDVAVEIEGHADSDGDQRANKILSERRAQAVVAYLVRFGIDAERLKAVGYGDARPLVPNTTKANKARNRRIDFAVRMR